MSLHRPAQEQRLHEAESIIAHDPPRQRHIVRAGGVPFGKSGLFIGFGEVVEYIVAAMGAEIVAVVDAVALDAENVGGLGGGVGDVAGDEGG